MSSKFDQLCNLVVEKAETSLIEASDPVYYGLNPEFDSAGLTGYDKLVANFVEEKPATADEILDLIQRNSEEPDNRAAATEVLRNLIDGGVLTQSAAPSPAGDEVEGEPDTTTLQAEPEVDVNEPVTVPQPEEEDQDELPAPIASDAETTVAPVVGNPVSDEENTFDGSTPKSGIEATADDSEELDDDTPTSVLLKKAEKKRQQLAKMVRYLYAKRGKSPQEAEQYIQQATAKGLI